MIFIVQCIFVLFEIVIVEGCINTLEKKKKTNRLLDEKSEKLKKKKRMTQHVYTIIYMLSDSLAKKSRSVKNVQYIRSPKNKQTNKQHNTIQSR